VPLDAMRDSSFNMSSSFAERKFHLTTKDTKVSDK